MKKARLLLLDVIDGAGFTEITCSSLQDYYDGLKCDCFDIARRFINGKLFDIFCDDEGLFKDNPIPSALYSNMRPALVGNLIFANHDAEGNTTSLSDEDIEHIKNCAITLVNPYQNPPRVWTAINQVDVRM